MKAIYPFPKTTLDSALALWPRDVALWHSKGLSSIGRWSPVALTGFLGTSITTGLLRYQLLVEPIAYVWEYAFLIGVITSFQAISTPASDASLSAIAVLFLVLRLSLKELALTCGARWETFGALLDIAIYPLLIVFSVIVLSGIADVLVHLAE